MMLNILCSDPFIYNLPGHVPNVDGQAEGALEASRPKKKMTFLDRRVSIPRKEILVEFRVAVESVTV